MADRVNITSPIGRIVAGNLYRANEKDFDGKPLVVKTGPNAGQPRKQYFFALAIKKNGETHWAQTPWGQQIWAVGHTAFPQAAQRPDFAWKIDDGDSAVPNKRGRKPVDQEGYAGHWIVKFSGGYAPKIYRMENGGFVQELTEDFVKPGHFIEVAFNCDGNGNSNNPGVYLNFIMICFRAYGPEIIVGPNVEEAGFGQSPLPPDASAMPVGGSTTPLPSVGGPPQPPAVPSAPLPVTPNPAFVQIPPPPVVPQQAATGIPAVPGAASPSVPQTPSSGTSAPVPPAPIQTPPSSGRQMTAAANGVSYEAYLAAGWTDAQLIAQGFMTL